MSEHLADSTQSGTSPKSLKVYVTGLVLCLALTFLSFALVGYHWLAPKATYITIFILAIVQLFVQVICFLRLNTSRDGQWNLMPFLFTILIVLVVVIGSLWIMFNLNHFMMAGFMKS